MNEDRLFNLRFWKDLVSRQRWLILICTLVVTALAATFSYLQTPLYQGTCSLYLKDKRVQPLAFDDLYEKERIRQGEQVLAQMEIIRSTPVLERAVRTLEGQGSLTFNDGAPGEMTSGEKRTAYVRQLKRRVSVAPKKSSAFLAISVIHEKPPLASQLANAIANAYLESETEASRNKAEEASAWLSKRVREQKDKLLAAEEKLREFTASAAPKPEQVGQLPAQEINRLQQALLDVRLKILEEEAQEETQRTESAQSSGAPAAPRQDLQAEVDQALRERVRKELVDTSVNLSQLRQRYGERHPDVIAAAAKEKQLREQLASLQPPEPEEIPTPSGGTTKKSSTLAVLLAQQKLLSENLNQLMQSSVSKGEVGVQSVILEREVEINRSLYNEMLSRLNAITLASGLDSIEASVFEPAIVPDLPFSPDHKRNLLLGLMAGFVLGLVSATVREHLDQSVRHPMEANDLLRAPVLGVIPMNGRGKQHEPGQLAPLAVCEGEYTEASEAYLVLRSHLEGSLDQEDSRVLLVTSAVPGEGKSTTAANLAAAFAGSGNRVLLVDGDLRRPSLSRYFRFDRETCISQVLIGLKPPEEVVRSTRVENLFVLGCQPGSLFPAGARLTESFRNLFAWAKTRYDKVIVDMPIVMFVPGVAEIARAGASVLLVHRPGSATSQALEQVREHLSLSKTPLVGVVLNGVRSDWLGGSYPLRSPYYYHSTRVLSSSSSDEERA